MGSGGSPSRTPVVELRDSADVCLERGTCERVKSDKERKRRIKLLPQNDEQHNKTLGGRNRKHRFQLRPQTAAPLSGPQGEQFCSYPCKAGLSNL